MDVTKQIRNNTSWLFDNKKLIEKLELAYQNAPNKKDVSGALQLYGFKTGNLNLIIDENTACEILEEKNIHFVPLSAKWLVGVSNIRGDVIPIIDLEKLITGENISVISSNRKVAIIGKGEDAIGLELDELPILLDFSNAKKLVDYSNQVELIQPHIRFAYMKDDDIWLCINFSSFIQSIEF